MQEGVKAFEDSIGKGFGNWPKPTMVYWNLPWNGSEWAIGDKGRLINIILNGMEGSVSMNGEVYMV